MILSRRPNDDDSRDGFTKWPFMTTHTWAEDPRGTWHLEVRRLPVHIIGNNVYSVLFILMWQSKSDLCVFFLSLIGQWFHAAYSLPFIFMPQKISTPLLLLPPLLYFM